MRVEDVVQGIQHQTNIQQSFLIEAKICSFRILGETILPHKNLYVMLPCSCMYEQEQQ